MEKYAIRGNDIPGTLFAHKKDLDLPTDIGHDPDPNNDITTKYDLEVKDIFFCWIWNCVFDKKGSPSGRNLTVIFTNIQEANAASEPELIGKNAIVEIDGKLLGSMGSVLFSLQAIRREATKIDKRFKEVCSEYELSFDSAYFVLNRIPKETFLKLYEVVPKGQQPNEFRNFYQASIDSRNSNTGLPLQQALADDQTESSRRSENKQDDLDDSDEQQPSEEETQDGFENHHADDINQSKDNRPKEPRHKTTIASAQEQDYPLKDIFYEEIEVVVDGGQEGQYYHGYLVDWEGGDKPSWIAKSKLGEGDRAVEKKWADRESRWEGRDNTYRSVLEVAKEVKRILFHGKKRTSADHSARDKYLVEWNVDIKHSWLEPNELDGLLGGKDDEIWRDFERRKKAWENKAKKDAEEEGDTNNATARAKGNVKTKDKGKGRANRRAKRKAKGKNTSKRAIQDDSEEDLPELHRELGDLEVDGDSAESEEQDAEKEDAEEGIDEMDVDDAYSAENDGSANELEKVTRARTTITKGVLGKAKKSGTMKRGPGKVGKRARRGRL